MKKFFNNLKTITAPSKEELTKLTAYVIIASVAIGAVVALYDAGILAIVNLFVG